MPATQYRFTFGPWNISQGADPFGPVVRKEVPFAKKVAQYRKLGHVAAFECTVGGAPLTYFDTVATIGHYTELWDNAQVFKDLFMTVEDAAKGWDGKHAVRKGPL